MIKGRTVRRVGTILFVLTALGFWAAAQRSENDARAAQQAVDAYDRKLSDQFSKVMQDPQSVDYAALNATKQARDLAAAEHKELARVANSHEAAFLVSIILFAGAFGALMRWLCSNPDARKRVMTKATLLTLACGVLLLFPPSRPLFTFIPQLFSEVGVRGLGQEGGLFVPSALGWVLAAVTVWLLAFANLPAEEDE